MSVSDDGGADGVACSSDAALRGAAMGAPSIDPGRFRVNGSQARRGSLDTSAGGPRFDRCYRPPMQVRRALLEIAWAVHRVVARVSGGRIGTVEARQDRLGMLYLQTIGRTTGQLRRNGLYYLPEGDAFVVIASNAGADEDPAWWRNLRAAPNATVELGGRAYPIHARETVGEEHDRLYERFEAVSGQFRSYRQAATRPIPVIVLEPRGTARD
jgi:deazaflavin-dependent oxidoreductase (nitroreductase family)